MIYGIKQIEKQFPGFEARWTGGALFDVRELGEFELLQDNPDMDPEAKLTKRQHDFIKDNWDYVIPPAEMCYFVFGKKPNTPGWVEIAVKAKREGDIVRVYDSYICTFDNLNNPGVSMRFQSLSLSDGGFLFDTWDDRNKKARSVFGKAIQVDRDVDVANTNEKKLFDKLDFIVLAQLGYMAWMSSMAMFFLNVRNIKRATKYISQQRGFYYPKAWGREYKVLSLSQTLTEHSPGPDLPPGYHVRGHFQRGHFKRKKTGVYWWNPHWRGDFSKGIVMKDYKMKGEINASENRKEVVPVPQGENAVVVH